MFFVLVAPPTIETPPATNADEENRGVPTIQSKKLSLRFVFPSMKTPNLAEESGYEEEGPRRSKPAEKTKRVSQSKLDVISENQSSKCLVHDLFA